MILLLNLGTGPLATATLNIELNFYLNSGAE
jgi:hypothetical protein